MTSMVHVKKERKSKTTAQGKNSKDTFLKTFFVHCKNGNLKLLY